MVKFYAHGMEMEEEMGYGLEIYIVPVRIERSHVRCETLACYILSTIASPVN